MSYNLWLDRSVETLRKSSLSLTHTRCTTHARSRTDMIYILHHIHTTHTQAVVRVYPLTMTLFFSTRALLNSTPRIHQDRQFLFCLLVFIFLFFYLMYNVSMRFNIRVSIFMNVAYIWTCYLYACVCFFILLILVPHTL